MIPTRGYGSGVHLWRDKWRSSWGSSRHLDGACNFLICIHYSKYKSPAIANYMFPPFPGNSRIFPGYNDSRSNDPWPRSNEIVRTWMSDRYTVGRFRHIITYYSYNFNLSTKTYQWYLTSWILSCRYDHGDHLIIATILIILRSPLHILAHLRQCLFYAKEFSRSIRLVDSYFYESSPLGTWIWVVLV